MHKRFPIVKINIDFFLFWFTAFFQLLQLLLNYSRKCREFKNKLRSDVYINRDIFAILGFLTEEYLVGKTYKGWCWARWCLFLLSHPPPPTPTRKSYL